MKPMVRVMAVGLIAAGVGVIAGRMLAPQPKPIPAEPLGKLQYGNELFAKGKLMPPKVDEMTRYKLESEGQKPFAIVVACSDSRVPPELIFNQGLGELFVVRVAGHVVNEHNLASIEYAVEHLKVPLLVVLGHTHCGAVKAAASGKSLEGHLPQLVDSLEPVVKRVRASHPHLKGDTLIERLIQENVRYTLQTIYTRSKVVRKHHQMGKLELAGGVYHLREGTVEWLKLPDTLGAKHEDHEKHTEHKTHTEHETHAKE